MTVIARYGDRTLQ